MHIISFLHLQVLIKYSVHVQLPVLVQLPAQVQTCADSDARQVTKPFHEPNFYPPVRLACQPSLGQAVALHRWRQMPTVRTIMVQSQLQEALSETPLVGAGVSS